MNLNGWTEEPLGELCDILDSRRKPVTKSDRKPGPFPYYGATGVQDYVADYIFDEPLVLVGEDGAKWGAGERSAFAVSGKCWVNNHAHVLRPKRSILLDQWLIHYLNHTDLLDYVSGVTVPKLNQGNLREIPIPLPPLPEQQRIVDILDEAFGGIATAKANAEKNLRNARAIFVSELQAVFAIGGDGWIDSTIGEMCTLRSGTTLSPSLERPTGDLPYLKVADMNLPGNLDGVETSTRFVMRGKSISEKMILPAGTVIFPKRGGAIATNKKRFVKRPICADLNIMGVIPGDAILPRLLYLYFLNVDLTSFGSGSSIPQVNNYDIEPLRISFPTDKNMQSEVAERLTELQEETQRLASLYQQKLAALDALKKSLLHQAFSGQLNNRSQ